MTSTLIPRGKHRHQKTRDKPITRPSKGYKPKSGSDRKRIWKRNSCNFCSPRERERSLPCSYDGFWGRCPGCNPPSVLSSICLIGEPAPPAEDHRRLLPLSHRCRDPFHPHSRPSIKAPRERADHRHLDRARSRFCAPAQALTWHLLRPQRSPLCGWSFLKTTTMVL